MLVELFDSHGNVRIEQFQLYGLAGNDVLGFVNSEDLLPEGVFNPVQPAFGASESEPLALTQLAERSNDWVSSIKGDSGNDTLIGSDGRDRLDGSSGSDVLYGLAGDDRLWGNDGSVSSSNEHDILYAGQGNDDLYGGQGTNQLYAWTKDPKPGLFGVYVDKNGKLIDDNLHNISKISGLSIDAADDVESFRFSLTDDQANQILAVKQSIW